MAAKYVLALDAGTSGMRCLVADLRGKTAAVCRRSYVYHYPPEVAPLGKEFEAEELWRTAAGCIRNAVQTAGIQPGEIAGISATSQREGAVFLDRKGAELYAGPNIDLRAVTEGLILDNQFADRIHAITGHLPSLLFVPAKLKWFEKNRADVFERIATVLSISDWLLYRLSGRRTSDICGAAEMGLADVKRRQWSRELCNILKLPDNIFPELVPAGTCAGKITPAASSLTGIPAGIPVIQGAPDSHCGLLALGVNDDRQVGIVSGWSTPIQMVTDKAVIDAERRIWTGCHIRDGKWILESNSGESGNSLRRVNELLLNRDEVDDNGYASMDRQASAAPPGAGGVLAFTGPEVMDCRNLSLRWGGFFFPVPFSAVDIDRAQLARAAIENICFAVRANCDQMEVVSGHKIALVKFGGGMVRSQSLRQILPSVLGRPVGFAAAPDTSGMGAAILAAAGRGIYSGPEEAQAAMASPEEVIEADPLTAAEYAEYYQRWLSMSRRLKEIGEELN